MPKKFSYRKWHIFLYFLKILANIERKNISFFGDLLTSQKENVILIKN
jgi:hypothetical protein